MGLGRYGQLVGRLAREAGFDAVENEVEAESVRLLADQDVNELSRRGVMSGYASGERLSTAVRAPWATSCMSSRGAKRRGRTCRRTGGGTPGRLTRAEPGVLEDLEPGLGPARHIRADDHWALNARPAAWRGIGPRVSLLESARWSSLCSRAADAVVRRIGLGEEGASSARPGCVFWRGGCQLDDADPRSGSIGGEGGGASARRVCRCRCVGPARLLAAGARV